MARYKYYMSYQHDHEECIEEVSDEEYHKLVNQDDSELSINQWREIESLTHCMDGEAYHNYMDSLKWVDIQNKRTGEKLIIRVAKNGKSTALNIDTPYCDFQEHFRERIKAPKGYMKRNGRGK